MFFITKNYKFLILAIILLIVLAYATNISTIPESLILFQNENLKLKTIAGIKIEESIMVDAKISYSAEKNVNSNRVKREDNNAKSNEREYNLSLLGFNVKKIKTNIIPTTKVIPLGNLIGLKLYTKGVLVVGVSEVKGEDNKIYKPYEEAGIELGDTILEISGEPVNTTEKLISCVSKCKGGSINIKYESKGKILNTTMSPVKTNENSYKVGLWVRDAAAGVGTLTFYDKSNNKFATLGHGIQDVDTEELVNISTGEIVTADIIDIQKGKENNPGKIKGSIEDSKEIGKIYSNTDFGIYGVIDKNDKLKLDNIEEVDVASRNEIKLGKAKIICTLENNERKEYEIQIEKVYINNNENNKSMVVKVTDKELIEKTGGIIQGMSGAPIIQNGKLIGALTHVFVSDPTKGYGLFADKMLQQLKY